MLIRNEQLYLLQSPTTAVATIVILLPELMNEQKSRVRVRDSYESNDDGNNYTSLQLQWPF